MTADSRRRSVLIADDDHETLHTISAALRRGGYIPRPVTRAGLAIEAAVAEPPELFLVSTRLPDLPGRDLCKFLKSDNRFSDAPVILVIVESESEEAIEAIRAGADDLLYKPFRPESALARVRTLFRLKELRDELTARTLDFTARHEKMREMMMVVSDTARDAIIIMDDQGKISHWNRAAATLFGYSYDEAIGRDLHALIAPRRYQAAFAENMPRFRATGEGGAVGKTLELVGVTKSGEEVPIELALSAANMEGRWYAVGIIRDISERKAAEERLKAEIAGREKIEMELRHSQKMEAVGQLAAGIAHEINTPIQYIGDSMHFLREAFLGYRRLVADYRRTVDDMTSLSGRRDLADAARQTEEEIDLAYLEENVPGSFNRCLDGISRIAEIVRAMKEFGHADSREKSPADLNRAIMNTLVIATNEYKYVADVETDLGDLPPVLCHIGDIGQVILNLIVNAAHAIADVVGTTGERGKILLTTRQEDRFARIDVRDSGAGIPESVRERIFEPFFTTKPLGLGTGQGLPIAHSIVVDKHGGSISFATETGKGTTFTVRLPIDGRSGAEGMGFPPYSRSGGDTAA